MANALYDTGRQGFLDGSFDWASSSVKAMLVGSGYTANLASDEFVTDLPSGAVIARSADLAGKTETGGVADANDITFTAVPGGMDVYFLVVYEDTGADSSSRLIALIDTATGLPLTPTGGDVSCVWDSGTNKIFKL